MIVLGIQLIPLCGLAQMPQDYEKVLIPVVPGNLQPGAHGSLWKTEWVAFNSGSRAARWFHDFVTPFCSFNCPHRPLEPSETIGGSLVGTGGALVYFERPMNEDIRFQLRIRDLTLQALTWGTEIPVVREEEAFTTSIDLLDVPLDSRFRQTLRIYDFDARSISEVNVRIWNQAEGTLAAERRVTLGHRGPQRVIFPIFPGYVQVGDFITEFPSLAGIERIRVEIEPVSPDLKFWAFLSVTNNETQHVTTITPQ